MFAKAFIPMFVGAVCASGWWAWSIYAPAMAGNEGSQGILALLIAASLGIAFWLFVGAVEDMTT